MIEPIVNSFKMTGKVPEEETKLLPLDLQEAYGRLTKRLPLLSAEAIVKKSLVRQRKAYEVSKRAMDISVALAVILLTCWLYPFISAAIFLEDGRPVFRREKRVGKDGNIFVIVKFRSMRKDTPVMWVTKKDSRVTRVGRILRKTRLDELPQLFSVLKGDLSLVGPRPDIIDFFPLLKESIPRYLLRYQVKPGMTGWAQVQQAIKPASVGETTERFEYDLYYLAYRSFWLDMKILLRTFLILFGVVSKDPSTH